MSCFCCENVHCFIFGCDQSDFNQLSLKVICYYVVFVSQSGVIRMKISICVTPASCILHTVMINQQFYQNIVSSSWNLVLSHRDRLIMIIRVVHTNHFWVLFRSFSASFSDHFRVFGTRMKNGPKNEAKNGYCEHSK